MKKQGEVKAGMIKVPPGVEIVNPDEYLFTIDSPTSVFMEIDVRKGRGYEPVEKREEEELKRLLKRAGKILEKIPEEEHKGS